MEEVILNFRQKGFINFGSMTLLVGGLALAGLLAYGLTTGHELPLWPAVAVALVNLVGAGKLIHDVRRARRQEQAPPATPAAPPPSGPSRNARRH